MIAGSERKRVVCDSCIEAVYSFGEFDCDGAMICPMVYS